MMIRKVRYSKATFEEAVMPKGSDLVRFDELPAFMINILVPQEYESSQNQVDRSTPVLRRLESLVM